MSLVRLVKIKPSQKIAQPTRKYFHGNLRQLRLVRTRLLRQSMRFVLLGKWALQAAIELPTKKMKRAGAG